MPSAYAHYRFGRQVCPLLDSAGQRTILSRPEPFLIGLHGPDIFFYHHPLGSSAVKQMGHRMHAESAEAFFRPAADRLALHPDRQGFPICTAFSATSRWTVSAILMWKHR